MAILLRLHNATSIQKTSAVDNPAAPAVAGIGLGSAGLAALLLSRARSSRAGRIDPSSVRVPNEYFFPSPGRRAALRQQYGFDPTVSPRRGSGNAVREYQDQWEMGPRVSLNQDMTRTM